MPDAYEVSAGLFLHALTNLKAQLTKAENHAASTASGEASLLNARLATHGFERGAPAAHPADLHMYTLAAQVHWAAEGARLAIARLLGAPVVPVPNDAKSFADLHQRIEAAIGYLREVAPSALEAGLEREIVVEHRRGSVQSDGRQFLLRYAIPHFFYHVITAYGIMRNHGVQLTMGDFLGNYGAS